LQAGLDRDILVDGRRGRNKAAFIRGLKNALKNSGFHRFIRAAQLTTHQPFGPFNPVVVRHKNRDVQDCFSSVSG
jgi:hypothetical protein